MSEYRLVLPKQNQGGFAQSPEQDTGNAGSPLLDTTIKTKDAVGIGVAGIYGKKVLGSVYSAVAGQLGSARNEEITQAFSKIGTYAFLAVATGGFTIPALALGAEAISMGLNNVVENHAVELQNQKLRAARGVRVSYSAGGYYG